MGDDARVGCIPLANPPGEVGVKGMDAIVGTSDVFEIVRSRSPSRPHIGVVEVIGGVSNDADDADERIRGVLDQLPRANGEGAVKRAPNVPPLPEDPVLVMTVLLFASLSTRLMPGLALRIVLGVPLLTPDPTPAMPASLLGEALGARDAHPAAEGAALHPALPRTSVLGANEATRDPATLSPSIKNRSRIDGVGGSLRFFTAGLRPGAAPNASDMAGPEMCDVPGLRRGEAAALGALSEASRRIALVLIDGAGVPHLPNSSAFGTEAD